MVSAILCAWAYRFRGTAKPNWNTNEGRVVFAGVFFLCTTWITYPYLHYYNFAILPLAFAASTLPHGFCMDLGRNSKYQKGPTSFLMPSLDQEQWDCMTYQERRWFDIWQFRHLGVFQGLILFLPAWFFGHSLIALWIGILTLSLLQPIAYELGYSMKKAVTLKVRGITLLEVVPGDTSWGELYRGAAWIVAYGMFLTASMIQHTL